MDNTILQQINNFIDGLQHECDRIEAAKCRDWWIETFKADSEMLTALLDALHTSFRR